MNAYEERHARIVALAPSPYATEGERLTWDLEDRWGYERSVRGKLFRKLPKRFHAAVADTYRTHYVQRGNVEANRFLYGISDSITGPALKLAASDEEIVQAAKRYAQWCRVIARSSTSEEVTFLRSLRFCETYGISPASLVRNVRAYIYTFKGALNRFGDEYWWRRQLRQFVVRKIENAAIGAGLVHCNAGLYVSEEMVQRRRQQKARNRRTLEGLRAVNELGQEFTVQQLADLSTSNPHIRRAELMTRIAGFEQVSHEMGHMGVFLTITCPSRMHARLHNGGIPNCRYDNTTPRQAQQYLAKVWARIRAKLKRRGIQPYGFRVAEPQHDGTPHWHLLLFVAEERLTELEEIFRHYALQVDGNEPGATSHRLKVVRIDKSKGTAAGYIAKYVAKNIDGFGLESDAYGHDAKSGAVRVDAWASTWGIRQFQQIGGPPVGLWRELRKCPIADGGTLVSVAASAADSGDWAAFVGLMGGPSCSRRDRPLHIMKVWDDRTGRYGEPIGYRILGVQAGNVVQVTRIHEWKISRITAPPLTPWSTVNNCTEC